VEQAEDQQKEVVQAALGQRGPNGKAPLPLAETPILDVGMSDILILGGRVGIEAHHAIPRRRS
jgi:hypothetical protein